jgi:predicted Zn-dependent protease
LRRARRMDRSKIAQGRRGRCGGVGARACQRCSFSSSPVSSMFRREGGVRCALTIETLRTFSPSHATSACNLWPASTTPVIEPRGMRVRVAKDYRRRAERPAGIALRGLWAGASTRSTTRRRRQQRRRTMASIDVAAACGGGRRGGGGGGGGGDGGKEVAAAAAAAAEGGREAQQSSRGQRQPRRAKPKEKCARQSAAESALHTAASTRRPLRFSKVVELRWQSQLIRFATWPLQRTATASRSTPCSWEPANPFRSPG